ncbi:MAG: hypothetical protein MK295_01090 [Pseudomonadales bacterium]|nr:hypothetical protein [Pseudomonadales bacterium]
MRFHTKDRGTLRPSLNPVTGVEGDLPNTEELRPFTARRLANYEIAKQITELDELPLLANGEGDKQALRELHDAS